MLKWLNFWRRRDREIQNEIDYHLEMLTQDRVDRGSGIEEARFAARRKLGNVTRVKENTRRIWILPIVESLFQDVEYALRSFRRTPTLFALIISILALGIATSVAVFSLVDGLLLRPLPYRDPQRLVTLTTYAPRPPFDSNGSMSYKDFLQLKAKSHSFSDLAVTFRDGWSRVR